MTIAFFILLIIIFLLILPVKFKVKFNYNVFKNRGHLKIKVFNFKLLYYKIKYKDKKIILSNFKTTKEISLDINIENIDFVNELQKQIKKRLYLKEIKCYFNFGIADNSFITAMVCAGGDIALSIISSMIKFQKPTSNINYRISNFYTKDICDFSLETQLSISITNLLLSLLKTKKVINKKEQLKENGRKAKASY